MRLASGVGVFIGGCWVAGFVRAGGPEGGVDVGEDAVAEFDCGEAFAHVFVEGAVGFEGLPDGLEFVELVVVGEEAELGVVAGGAGGDEELPVGGFEQEELAAELLRRCACRRFGVAASGRRCRRRGV